MAEFPAFDFTALQQTLLDWPVSPPPLGTASGTSLLGRLRQTLVAVGAGGGPASAPDLMVLIRQLLIERSTDGQAETLSVPRGRVWPAAEDWRQFGCEVTQTAERLILRARPWRPDWLSPSLDGADDIFAAEHQARPVRVEARVTMDPFLRDATGLDTYVCPGQREAVLSALCMPAGSTLIVNLPTGGGKSLVAQAPVLLRGLESGLTLYIVPTNALALDLQRRTLELLAGRRGAGERWPLAWIGGRDQVVRNEIKQRVRAGTQGILFASPEAVCGALLPALYQAAERGALSYLVVDEAHLIAQWGDDFRPAFQQLAGVRRGLLKACPDASFRTLLLSATISSAVIGTLETLFGPSEHLQMVSAVHLRPEPRYLCRRVRDRDEKRARLLEMLHHVPRPFILYTTTRDDARRWYRELRDVGYARLACFHGETADSERGRIIDDWVHDRLDGVVATSAFGVGMDKADVRSVIHAALPETLDRFYQEVGRGGRDGRASLSITLFDATDQRIAWNMTTPTLIGDERGFARWRTLYHEGTPDPNDPDVRLVDLSCVPGGLTQQSDFNRDWNMRTLILLARAGLIHLESARPALAVTNTEGDGPDVQTRSDAEWDDYFEQIPVRVLDGRLLDQGFFEQRIGDVRQRGTTAAEHAFEQMLDALQGRREMAGVLGDLYAIDAPGRSVIVSTVCRGCPASDGAAHAEGTDYRIPAGIGVERVTPWDDAAWRRGLPGLAPTFAVVLCPGRDWPNGQVLTALKAAVGLLGVLEVAAPRRVWQGSDLAALHRSAPGRLLIQRNLEDIAPSLWALPVPRASLLLPWDEQPMPDELFLLNRPLHLVFVPEDIADGSHPLRRWRDTATNFIALDDFLRRTTR